MEEKIYEYWKAEKELNTFGLPKAIQKKIAKIAKEHNIKKYQVVCLAIDAYQIEDI